MCAKLVDKYISNIFPWQAKSFEHVDVLCGLGTTLYNLLPCGTVNTISGNLAGLYPSTFADPRFRNEDSVFVTHECSSGGQEGKSLKDFVISAS